MHVLKVGVASVSQQCKDNSIYFVELFSGSGKPSAAMRKRGFKVFPIDQEFNSHKQEVSTISLNFQNAKSQQLVEEMILENKPAALHSGVACGTCSRGRDKPLPSHLRKSFNDPPPLRDAANRLGFKHLSGTNQNQAQAANFPYMHAWWLQSQKPHACLPHLDCIPPWLLRATIAHEPWRIQQVASGLH